MSLIALLLFLLGVLFIPVPLLLLAVVLLLPLWAAGQASL